MDGFDFPVEVIRTERKRSASIHLDGLVVKVRVPKSLSDSRIRALITKRKPWIVTRLKEASERAPIKPKEFVSGEAFPYLDRNYRLKVLVGDEPAIKLRDGNLKVMVTETDKQSQEAIRSLVVDWYQKHALKRLEEKTERFSKTIGVSPKSITIKDYKSRWGSCSIHGDISYNWRIILAPHRIIDYVVVHELCHLLEHNHSNQYWKHVERYVSDYKERRNWLKSEASRLLI